MTQQRDSAAVSVFPPAIPIVTILIGVALHAMIPLGTASAVAPLIRYVVGGAIVVGSVLGFGAWSVLLVRRSGQSENPWKPTTEVIQRGPYRLSRNPMYLQMVLVCVGFSVLLWNPWILLLSPLCGWLLQRWVIVHEEAYLEAKFGDAYRAYRGRVRRWI
jgi:protein-S-isoprenylcysteine O-methyltransferase Ste14